MKVENASYPTAAGIQALARDTCNVRDADADGAADKIEK
jgi:hypothetical protein